MKEIERVAVIGAGNMGSGIAQKYASEGITVLVLDLDEAALARGRASVERTLQEGVERKIFRPDEAKAILDRMTFALDWAKLSEVELVIEAVFEDLEVKRKVFQQAAAHASPQCLLATNTSSFYVRQLAETTPYPERVLGLHYFYHPAKNRLVEVIAGPSTPPESVRQVWVLQERIGKTPIASLDAPGFVVNRFFVPFINEAARLHEEGVANLATIEEAAKEGFGIGMGPFQLMNVTGIPIGYHAASTLERELGRFYQPSGIIHGYMESGRTFDFTGEVDRSKFQQIQERLEGVVYYVATALVSEGVGSIEDVDIGARVGLRWAHGPFEMMNRRGLTDVGRFVREVEQYYGLERPTVLKEQIASGHPFLISLVRYDVNEAVATITFNRPDAMNALSPAVFEQFEPLVEKAIADPAVQGIVITGTGKAFVAGADLRFFIGHMKAGAMEEIVAFARRGQELLKRMERAPKPVVARLNGMALGGGLELALACDSIVAADRAVLGFPETGIGIYPGLGGTQRTSRRVGIALTRWLVYTGQMVDAKTAARIGLADRAVPYSDLDRATAEALAEGKKASARLDAARPEPVDAVKGDAALSALAGLFEGLRVEPLLAGPLPVEQNPDAAKWVGRVRQKAPLALKVSEKLIDAGVKASLDAGLEAELAQMESIFRTADALEGITSVGKRRPEFKGA